MATKPTGGILKPRLWHADLLGSFLSLFYPLKCCICGEIVSSLSTGAVCKDCWSNTQLFSTDSSLCSKCGAFNSENKSTNCGQCKEQTYDFAFSLGLYEKALKAAILQLKSAPKLSNYLKNLIANSFENNAVNFDVIVPVPLSKRRLHERGFNQAEVIANAITEFTNAPIDRNSLQRSIHTQMHRVGMDKKAREKTVKKAFSVTRPKMIIGKKILLTDDVFTSGGTAAACAETLKLHGADIVTVFTLAHAEFHKG